MGSGSAFLPGKTYEEGWQAKSAWIASCKCLAARGQKPSALTISHVSAGGCANTFLPLSSGTYGKVIKTKNKVIMTKNKIIRPVVLFCSPQDLLWGALVGPNPYAHMVRHRRSELLSV